MEANKLFLKNQTLLLVTCLGIVGIACIALGGSAVGSTLEGYLSSFLSTTGTNLVVDSISFDRTYSGSQDDRDWIIQESAFPHMTAALFCSSLVKTKNNPDWTDSLSNVLEDSVLIAFCNISIGDSIFRVYWTVQGLGTKEWSIGITNATGDNVRYESVSQFVALSPTAPSSPPKGFSCDKQTPWTATWEHWTGWWNLLEIRFQHNIICEGCKMANAAAPNLLCSVVYAFPGVKGECGSNDAHWQLTEPCCTDPPGKRDCVTTTGSAGGASPGATVGYEANGWSVKVGGIGVQYGPIQVAWNCCCDPPATFVELSSFTVTGYEGYVEVEWTTAAEIDNAGFNLHRGLSKERPSAQLNAELIPSQGDELQGASYSFTDYDVTEDVTYYYWLEDVDLYGRSTMHGPVSAAPTSVEEREKAPIPTVFSLAQNYPNPFNVTTEIKYGLPVESDVSLTIYSILGQRVITLVDGHQKAGYKTATWDASSFSSGIYFYRLQAGDFVQTRKMVLIR